MQHLPLNDDQVEKSSFHGRCHFGTSVGRTGTLESRSSVAVVVFMCCLEALHVPAFYQRRRDHNKNKVCIFEGEGHWGREENHTQNAVFFCWWETPRQYNFESAILIVENFCWHCAGFYSE